jgi:predicted transcriptional regulator of viral defense system
MDWVTALRSEAQTNSVVHADELARKYKIGPVAVSQALARQQQRGLVEHIGKKIYFNFLASNASPRELVNVLRTKAYVSLETALREYGISTQSPRAITCVTTERPRVFKGQTIRIIYRSISRQLYWGFVRKQTRYGSYQLAEPEKAILDSVYLALQEGIVPALDELEFERVSRSKLVDYAHRFPSTVYKQLLPTLETRPFAA